MGPDLGEIESAGNGNFDRACWVPWPVFEILHHGDDPDQVDVRRRFIHQTRRDTKTFNLGLELLIDDFVSECGDRDLLVLWPTDNSGVLVIPGVDLLAECVIVLFLLVFPSNQGTNGWEVARLFHRLRTRLVALDTVGIPREKEDSGSAGDDGGREE